MRVIEDRDKLASDPLVSIMCITYNQRDYIRDALDSFLSQKVDFSYEILVNDDCSTDGTTDILLDYQRRHPDVMRVVTHEENQYSRGVSPMGEFLVPLSRGSYVAMCEGDDYWTDEDKLAIQVKVLQDHPGLAACVHANENVQAETKRLTSTVRFADHDCPVSVEDAVVTSKCYATNSLLVRDGALRAYRESPIFRLRADGDHKMLLYFTLVGGGIYYIDRVMSAYRVLAKNSVNRTMLLGGKTEQIAKSKHEGRVELLKAVDEMTRGEYHDALLRGVDAMDYAYYRDIRDLRELRRRWPERLRREGFLAWVDLLTFTYCKPLHRLLLRIYCR